MESYSLDNARKLLSTTEEKAYRQGAIAEARGALKRASEGAIGLDDGVREILEVIAAMD